MKKNSIIFATHIIFLLHIFAVLVLFFGAFIPEIRWLYQFGLVLTILSWLFSSGCFLTVWEYQLRKKINPDLEIYEYGFVDFYLREFFKGTARPKFIHRIGLFFLSTSLAINIYTYGIVLW